MSTRSSAVKHASLKERVKAELRRNRPKRGFAWQQRFFYWCLSVVVFAVVSAGALSVALGYRVNWVTRSIQETAIVQLRGPLVGVPLSVYLDSHWVGNRLPLSLRGVVPGQYRLRIVAEGYQPWERSITIGPNQRAIISDILLVYEELPTVEPPPDLTFADPRFTKVDREDLFVQHANEIWLKDVFVTRTSADIEDLRWFPGRQHFLALAGGELLLISREGYTTLTILRGLPQNVQYFIDSDGRTLVYLDAAGEIQARALFEERSLIDRWVGSR